MPKDLESPQRHMLVILSEAEVFSGRTGVAMTAADLSRAYERDDEAARADPMGYRLSREAQARRDLAALAERLLVSHGAPSLVGLCRGGRDEPTFALTDAGREAARGFAEK